MVPDLRQMDPDFVENLEDWIFETEALNTPLLVRAYERGIFPWPMEKTGPIIWFCPKERAVLFLENWQPNRSLQRALKKKSFRISQNEAFDQVIEACAKAPRGKEGDTSSWIIPAMIDAYKALHQEGIAKSFEAWEGDRLVGGIYGVEVQGVFSAESMFYREPNASKIALFHLIQDLRKRGHLWVDFQVINDFTKSLGTSTIPRREFLSLLTETQLRSHSR